MFTCRFKAWLSVSQLPQLNAGDSLLKFLAVSLSVDVAMLG